MTPQPVSSPEPNDLLARRLTAALESTPLVPIPLDFAARVAAQFRTGPAPRRVLARAVPASRGLHAALVMTIILLVAAMFVTRHASTAWSFSLQTMFAVEFIALVLFAALRPRALR